MANRRHFWALLLYTCSFQALAGGTQHSFLGHPQVHKPKVTEQFVSDLFHTPLGFNFSEVSDAVQTIFKTLPKTENGGVDSTSLHYIANSFFMKERNWFILGLDPLHAHSVKKALESGELSAGREHLPTLVESLIDQKRSGGGYHLGDAVTFVTMIGNMILMEDIKNLQDAYAAGNLKTNSSLTPVQASSVLQKWAGNPLLQSLSSDVVQNYAFAHAGIANPFKDTTYSFSDVAGMMETANAEYVHARKYQCQELKERLTELDAMGTGRVSLGHFYATGLKESPQYLRHLGVLDESAAGVGPQLLIANYVAAPPNCEKISGHHSNCCLHECEELFSQLHAKMNSSHVDPTHVARIVSQMSSTTVEAPRELPSKLMEALRNAASAHGGKINLHGRLFAQWMHYAFPHECPYIWASHQLKPLAQSYLGQKGGNAEEASQDEMYHYMEQMVQVDASLGVSQQLLHGRNNFYMSQWTNEEEMRTGVRLHPEKGLPSWLKPVIAVCPACCIIVWLWRSIARLSEPQKKSESPV